MNHKKGVLGVEQKHQLTNDVYISELCFSRHRVDLTHVSAVIFLFDVVYMEKPGSMLIMFIVCYADPWVSSDYMIMNGQNGRLLEMYPRNLQIEFR